ncbi:MAG: helix-turn-helix transcriptional regulator [Prevotella sp.]
MKQLLYLIIIYIVVAACAGQHEANGTLDRAAAILDNRPDTSVTDAQLDSTVARNAMQEPGSAQVRYDYTESQRLAAEEAAEINRLRNLQVGLIAAFLVIMACIRYNKKQYEKEVNKQLKETNRKYVEAMELYIRKKEELEELKTDVQKYEANKRQEADQLSEVLASYHENTNMEVWNMEQQLMRHSIVQQLHQHSITLTEPTASEWADLYKAFSNLSPHFYQVVNDPQWQLTDREIKVCMLIRLHFIPSQIAILLNISKQRITNIRAQINLKMFKEKGTKHLDKNIGSI